MEENKEDVSSTIVNNYYGSEPNEDDGSNERSISFSQIWHMIKKHWVAIAVCTLVGLAGGVVYGRVIKKPEYQATSQVMVVNTEAESESSTDISGNLNIAKQQAAIAYGYMTTTEVREATCKALAPTYPDYDISDDSKKDKAMETLAKQYTVTLATVGSTSTTSIFISVTATTSEKQRSIDLANTVANVTHDLANGSGTVSSVLKNSIVVTEAMTSTDSSTSNVVIALIGTLIGLVVGCAYAIIRELANTKVTSKFELEQLTGVKVIGMIPKYMDDEANKEDEDNE